MKLRLKLGNNDKDLISIFKNYNPTVLISNVIKAYSNNENLLIKAPIEISNQKKMDFFVTYEATSLEGLFLSNYLPEKWAFIIKTLIRRYMEKLDFSHFAIINKNKRNPEKYINKNKNFDKNQSQSFNKNKSLEKKYQKKINENKNLINKSNTLNTVDDIWKFY